MGEWDKELGWEDSDRLLIAVLYCCERHQLDLGDRKKELSEMFQRRCWLSILTWGSMRMIEFVIKQTTSWEEEHIITNTSLSPWWKHRESKDENWHLHGSAVVAAESGMEYWEKERTKQKKWFALRRLLPSDEKVSVYMLRRENVTRGWGYRLRPETSRGFCFCASHTYLATNYPIQSSPPSPPRSFLMTISRGLLVNGR